MSIINLQRTERLKRAQLPGHYVSDLLYTYTDGDLTKRGSLVTLLKSRRLL
jgi:hypothetical protein